MLNLTPPQINENARLTLAEIRAKIDFITLKAASAAYGNEMPDTWEDFTEEEQSQWLLDNQYHCYDGLSADKMFSLIDGHAVTVKFAIKQALQLLKDELIVAAIENELPSDFNELNLEFMLGI